MVKSLDLRVVFWVGILIEPTVGTSLFDNVHVQVVRTMWRKSEVKKIKT